jgi:hypothetical protein
MFEFLRRNNIPDAWIRDIARQQFYPRRPTSQMRQFRRRARAYEDMGMIMSTWYTQPSFLDRFGEPLPLSAGRGQKSIANLVRASRINTPVSVAVKLLRQSPSVRFDRHGNYVPVKRMFILPDFEVLRAAIVIERFLNTLRRNFSSRRGDGMLLLERSCHVTGIDLKNFAPILRDIKERGSAFMDAIDGEIEDLRKRGRGKRAIGEMGVLTFAWTARGSKAHANSARSTKRRAH